MTAEEKKMHLQYKRYVDNLKMNYLNNLDIEICNYVSSQLRYTSFNGIDLGSSISLDRLIEMSLDDIKIFRSDIYFSVYSLISSVPICMEYDNLIMFTTVWSIDTDSNGEVIRDSGRIQKYIIPKQLFELSAYSFGHEHIHALKETNYDEAINGKVLGEVIPLFFELMDYDSDKVLKNKLIKFRLASLFQDANRYSLFNASIGVDMNINGEEDFYHNRSLEEYLRCTVGGYLNSFYYAVILNKMYEETPEKILNLVSKVLKHEMTTLQLLEFLGIYGDIRGEVFEKELGNIRRLIK